MAHGYSGSAGLPTGGVVHGRNRADVRGASFSEALASLSGMPMVVARAVVVSESVQPSGAVPQVRRLWAVDPTV